MHRRPGPPRVAKAASRTRARRPHQPRMASAVCTRTPRVEPRAPSSAARRSGSTRGGSRSVRDAQASRSRCSPQSCPANDASTRGRPAARARRASAGPFIAPLGTSVHPTAQVRADHARVRRESGITSPLVPVLRPPCRSTTGAVPAVARCVRRPPASTNSCATPVVRVSPLTVAGSYRGRGTSSRSARTRRAGAARARLADVGAGLITNVTPTPVRPARPVRPMRCSRCRGIGGSKFTTWVMSSRRCRARPVGRHEAATLPFGSA